MDQIEKVERLREKTGVSYSEAKQALEQSGGDLLEALCWLEQQGKIPEGGSAYSTTANREAAAPEEPQQAKKEPGGFEKGVRSLWDGLVELFRMSIRNELVMTSREGQRQFGMPVLLFIILAVSFFWIIALVVVIALFCGSRLSFQGPDLGKESINNAMGKATDFAESIKDEFTENK